MAALAQPRRCFARACLCILPFAAPASAEPMSLQGVATAPQPGVAVIQPFFDRGLERPQETEWWRIRYPPEDRDELPQVPTGIIASMGSFGIRIDTDADGPAAAGLAWTPNPSISVVAGGSLSGGIGATLSVRLSF